MRRNLSISRIEIGTAYVYIRASFRQFIEHVEGIEEGREEHD